MMAGADEPATLSGLCQPMAMAMVTVFCSQSRASGVATPFRVEADGGTSEDSTMGGRRDSASRRSDERELVEDQK